MNYKHQEDCLALSQDRQFFALLWEQGTGKTKTAIDTAQHLFNTGKIATVIVVAPNGVSDNWYYNEIPKFCGVPWQAGLIKAQGRQDNCNTNGDRLQWLITQYSTIALKRIITEFTRWAKISKVMLILDESHKMKNPKTTWSKAIRELSELCPYRRILTGTPVANNPFDLWNQMDFLSPTILKQRSFFAFKHTYGVWSTGYAQGGRMFKKLNGFQNVDKLQALIAPHSMRVLKENVLDLPAKVYETRYVDLTPEQAKLYKDLKTKCMAELAGQKISASIALVELLRFQQIIDGFGVNETGEIFPIDSNRVDAIEEILEESSGQTIIWCRFVHDVNLIVDRLDKMCVNYVRYDGSSVDRASLVEHFQTGKATVFVGTLSTGAEGITLTAGSTVVYYSNSFKLTERLQSEDRCHRIGQNKSVLYIDLIAKNTVDEHIVKALRGKRDISSLITGDNLGEWI